MKIALTILLCVVGTCVFGQKYAPSFKLQPGAHYLPGNILVKVRDGYQEQVNQLTKSRTSARIKNVAVKSVEPVVKPELARKGATLRGPRVNNATVDISRYFSISFDPGQNIETYINQLYSTGYFEIIEPVYERTTDYAPNDPLISNQYFLGNVKATQAWDISKGDTSVTVAIVDSGGYLDHPDLAPQLFTNWAEYPPNGIDDDGNGFVDDYRGWDFAGSDAVAIASGSVQEDNNPNVPNDGLQSHGSWVAGCASAATDNGTGVAGIGFKTRIMFTKHSADNQDPTLGSVYFGYKGMLYAANLGIKIINLSWGGGGRSQIEQDMINHVTVDLGCLVIAAAGNNNSPDAFYPAGYDHVLSVGATDAQDVKASFSNYGKSVDLFAPGVSIATTGYNHLYYFVNGTSFSAPITTGAAALVWAHNPSLTWEQVAQQLRATADANALYAANPSSYANQLGKGRLDIYRALTLTTPSVRATNATLVASAGGKSYLSFDFTNHLASTGAGLQISITGSIGATISKGTITPGAIAGGTTISNKQNPFEITVNAVAENSNLSFLITYTDGDYSDFQYVDLVVNRSYVDVTTARVGTTVTNIGRLGFQDPATGSLGQGFAFDEQQMLFEMGLIMGTSANQLYSNVRGATGEFTQDFTSLKQISQSTPGARSASEVSGEFSNSSLLSKQAVIVDYTSLEWKDSPYDKFVIMEYKVKNPGASPLTNFYFGMFADWDITTWDAVDWSEPEKLSYVYSPVYQFAPYAGIQVLTGAPLHYAIDNDANVAGNPFGVYDGFTNVEKFQTISSTRETAAPGLHGSQDVSHVVSSGPYTINPGETITLAFAIHGAANLNDLKNSAQWADSVYNFTLKAVQPSADSVATCYGSTATLNAAGPSVIKWYANPIGGQSFFTGNQVITDNLFGDTTLYVSNAEQSFESLRTPVIVTMKANPTIANSGSAVFCEGTTIQLSVAPADSILWSTGATTPSISVDAGGDYFVTMKDVALNCQSTSSTLEITVKPAPVAAFKISGELHASTPLTFTDQSTGAVSWEWDFGDGKTSAVQNPKHTYTQLKDYEVSLTVTNDLGCQNTSTNSVAFVTGLEESASGGLNVFPNPVSSQVLRIEVSDEHLENASLQLTNSVGQVVFEQDISTSMNRAEIFIPGSTLRSGLYVVRLNLGMRVVTKKVIVN